MDILENPTKNLFFTGKGGVGKTSLACSVAIRLAERGKRVLLVCTDPASNLNAVLDAVVGPVAAKVSGIDNLSAVNIDPQAAALAYRERVVGPYRGVLPDAAVASMEEQLSGACTTEIAAFDEFAKLLGDSGATLDSDHLIFDTAPTGHTLRLLQLPAAWDDFIESNTTGTSCLGPLAGLQAQHALYKRTVETLTDPKRTTVVLVSRAEDVSLAEAARTRTELVALGITNLRLVVNGVFKASSDDPQALAWEAETRQSLELVPAAFAGFEPLLLPLLPFAPLGPQRLKALLDVQLAATLASSICSGEVRDQELPPGLEVLLDRLKFQNRGVIMTMGKGGVGKTRTATEIALCLVESGRRVHLATTDPADHLDHSLVERYPRLTVSRIDPQLETEKYSRRVMEKTGDSLDEQGRKLLEEDLRSPCTEEIAVFHAFASLVDEGEDGFVVLDTAPTGHTLLLLDAALAYHREVSRSMSELPIAVSRLLPRMRDGAFSMVIMVTLPEATPIQEAIELENDLRRAGIGTAAWVINQSLAPLAVSDPLLVARKLAEMEHIATVVRDHPGKVYLQGWRSVTPDTNPKMVENLAGD